MAHDFSQPEYLYRLARSGSSLDRETLAQAVTSILRTSLSSAERGLAQDILLYLLSEAEADLRKGLAEQLAHEPNCPQALLDYLIYENPFPIAEAVLKHSTKLTDEYLIEVAKHFDQSDYWMALAQRKHIGEDLSRFLIGTDDPEVYKTLLENKGAHLCNSGITWLVNAAPHMPELQRSLIMRPEVTADLAVQLYWHVSEDLRQEIHQRFTIDEKMLNQAMEHIIHRRIAAKRDMPKITQEAVIRAERMKSENNITSRQILEALKKGEVSLFICLWGALLSIDPELLYRKMEEDFVLSLTILAHAARITRSDYNTMFLQWRRLQPMQDPRLDSMELGEVMSKFDQMTLDKARQIIGRWNVPPVSTVH